MQLRCLIIDDEPLAHQVILQYCEDVPYLQVVGQCYRAMEAVDLLKTTEIDLIFLDIQMPKITGLEMLKIIDQSPQVIITTAFAEYALESYDLSVCDYLLKPFSLGRFMAATEKALKVHQLKYSSKEAKEKTLFIKSEKKLVRVQISDIYYLEAYGNYVKVWLQSDYLLTPTTLTQIAAELDGSFIQSHKSYLVHKHKMDYIEGNTIKMTNGKSVPLSKHYKADFVAKCQQ